ncbi:hypothetical protein CDL15_Pgr025995 [Punica granatum]|uniref:Uncharacterized protein n=1 Tax=Punica granatum TaxID=22663 RepID=A0A218WBG8_PUNGR|nr:hypothetical protein CDL15_Pgr025995 [Punica granatum]PKI43285.1 hypothetical protein CRG98_036371 [Punica granatum]
MENLRFLSSSSSSSAQVMRFSRSSANPSIFVRKMQLSSDSTTNLASFEREEGLRSEEVEIRDLARTRVSSEERGEEVGGGEGRGEAGGVGQDANEALEGEVGDEVGGGKDLHGGGAGVVTGVEPVLDARAVVDDAGGGHDVEGDGATEEAGHNDVEVVPPHSLPLWMDCPQ